MLGQDRDRSTLIDLEYVYDRSWSMAELLYGVVCYQRRPGRGVFSCWRRSIMLRRRGNLVRLRDRRSNDHSVSWQPTVSRDRCVKAGREAVTEFSSKLAIAPYGANTGVGSWIFSNTFTYSLALHDGVPYNTRKVGLHVESTDDAKTVKSW